MSLDFAVSIYVISALCGNFWQESTVNPGLFEGRKVVDILDQTQYGGFGLGQWTNSTTHDVYRRTELGEWLLENGYAFDDGYGQLEFLIYENTWYDTGVASEFNSLIDFLQSESQDINRLTSQYMIGWEGINDGSLGNRQQAAQKCFEYFQECIKNNVPVGDWIANNTYLSENDRLHNAWIIYNWFNGIVPDARKGKRRGVLIPIIANRAMRNRRYYSG